MTDTLMYTDGVDVGISFKVVGVPQQQGSKDPWGGEANKNLKPWRQTVSAEAVLAMTGREILTGPVMVGVSFRFPRPASHFGTGKNANKLKASAPVYRDGTPDLDKLLRAVGDALTGFVVRDDRQIVCWLATKLWGGTPGATIHIEPLTGEPHELDAAYSGTDGSVDAVREGVPG